MQAEASVGSALYVIWQLHIYQDLNEAISASLWFTQKLFAIVVSQSATILLHYTVLSGKCTA